MDCIDNLQGAINNVGYIISKDHGMCLKQYGKGERPYPQDCRPDLGKTNELDAYGFSRYQKFIRTFIWYI